MAAVARIMAKLNSLETTLREYSRLRDWSQDELARRAGLSRAGVAAIEAGRLVASAAAALALAAALECRVEDLFRLQGVGSPSPAWASPSRGLPSRYRRAEVAGAIRLFPVEPTLTGMVPHDGVSSGQTESHGPDEEVQRTLVLAGCDPAAGLLAAELARSAGVRLLALPRSSRAALALLAKGLVHVAGVHLAPADRPDGNADAVRETLGAGFTLLRVARWEEGVVVASSARLTSACVAARSRLR